MDHQTKPQLSANYSAKTIIAQGYAAHEPVPSALVAPIHMSATYLRDADNGYSSGYIYGRTDNPSVQQAENLIAELERADEALLFGSGMAAATSEPKTNRRTIIVKGTATASALRREASNSTRTVRSRSLNCTRRTP